MHTAGLKVACPATLYDAKGTLIVAIGERATAVLAAA
jgi:pyruvate/2-oxoglutarate/acetoin dehydrogenase E1 component